MASLLLGVFAIGFAPILVKWIQLPPTTIAAYRCFLGALALTFWVAFRRKSTPLSRPLWKDKNFLFSIIIAGVFFASDLMAWHRAVKGIGAGLGTIVANTQVFYLGAYGIFFKNERATPRYLMAVPMGFAGILLLVGIGSPQGIHQGPDYWFNVFLGLLTGLLYAVYVVHLHRADSLGRHQSSPAQRLAGILWAGCFVLLPTTLLEGTFHLPTSPSDVAGLLLLGIGVQVGGWLFISRGLPQVPLSRTGLIFLLQPVLSTLWGVLLFDEFLSPLQILGAGLAGLAIYLGSTRERKKS